MLLPSTPAIQRRAILGVGEPLRLPILAEWPRVSRIFPTGNHLTVIDRSTLRLPNPWWLQSVLTQNEPRFISGARSLLNGST